MLTSLFTKLHCPNCGNINLELNVFSMGKDDHVKDGALGCRSCETWYPIEDELLECIEPSMMYHADVAKFYQKHHQEFASRSIEMMDFGKYTSEEDQKRQAEQRAHFDEFAVDEKMSYDKFENLPFMVALRRILYDVWKTKTKDHEWLLDIGSGNGNSAFKMCRPNFTVIGMDISKNMMRRAVQRSKENGTHAGVSFFLGDANKLPVQDGSFDYAVTAGILSNLPDPRKTSLQLYRIIRKGGIHFGSENNKSIFRGLFDLLMKLVPTWKNKKGGFPEVGHKDLESWYDGQDVEIRSFSSTFLPPHVYNLLGTGISKWFLPLTDKLFRAIPFLKHQGGLIIFEIRKKA